MFVSLPHSVKETFSGAPRVSKSISPILKSSHFQDFSRLTAPINTGKTFATSLLNDIEQSDRVKPKESQRYVGEKERFPSKTPSKNSIFQPVDKK